MPRIAAFRSGDAASHAPRCVASTVCRIDDRLDRTADTKGDELFRIPARRWNHFVPQLVVRRLSVVELTFPSMPPVVTQLCQAVLGSVEKKMPVSE